MEGLGTEATRTFFRKFLSDQDAGGHFWEDMGQACVQGQARHKIPNGAGGHEELGWGGFGSHPCTGPMKTGQSTGRSRRANEVRHSTGAEPA